MIETTYVRLAQAAEMLNTNADTLLIAAAEGRIQLHWLLNRMVFAQRGYFEDSDDPRSDGGGWAWVPVEEIFKHFEFIPLCIGDVAELVKNGVTEWGGCDVALSLPATDETFWVWGGPKNLGQGWSSVSADTVFMSRADLEAVKTAHATPPAGTIKAPLIPRSIPRDGNLIATLAALLATWPGGAIPSGKDLEKAAQSLELNISDDTIRKALKAAQDAAPSLPLPK